MECFNCNRPAKIKLAIEPDFGDIYVCESTFCKEKAESDLKCLLEIAENARDRQGKSREQVEASEKIITISIVLFMLVGLIIIISLLK